jgi:asparagine N-glycosylation enzyme membrane subunit Stt3
MRHVWSLIAGVVIAPLAWFLIAFGQGAMSRGQSLNDFKGDFILGGLLVVGVGLLLGVIASLRVSPVGALVTSLAYLGASMFALFARQDALKVFSQEVTLGDYKTNLADPLNSSVLAIVGGILLVAVFSPARWRGAQTDTSVEQWAPPPPPAPWEPPSPAGVSPTTESGDTRPF